MSCSVDVLEMAYKLEPEDALKYLEEKYEVRNIGEVLKKAIQKTARKNLSAKAMDVEIRAEEDRLDRELKEKIGDSNISHWVNGKNKLERESAIKVAFILKMNPKDTDEFLKKCWHDGFYMRDVRDLIYIHGLYSGWSYEETKEIIEKFKYIDSPNPEPDVNDTELDRKLTDEINEKYIKSVLSKEEFETFIRDHEKLFGSFHRKAYDLFIIMYEDIKGSAEDGSSIHNYYHNKKIQKVRNGIYKLPIHPEGFIKHLSNEEIEIIKNCSGWLIGPNALDLKNKSEEEICELKKGVKILFDPEGYAEDCKIKKNGELNMIRIEMDLAFELKLEKEKLDNLKERLLKLFKFRNTRVLSTADLCEYIMMGILDIKKIIKDEEKNKIKIKENFISLFDKIAEHLPSRPTLTDIINKKAKIDRKLILLVYVLFALDAPEDHMLKYKKGDEMKAWKELIMRINKKMLEPCGMPLLDAKHPFDWILMNSLKCYFISGSDKDEEIPAIVDRMKDLISKLSQLGIE